MQASFFDIEKYIYCKTVHICWLFSRGIKILSNLIAANGYYLNRDCIEHYEPKPNLKEIKIVFKVKSDKIHL